VRQSAPRALIVHETIAMKSKSAKVVQMSIVSPEHIVKLGYAYREAKVLLSAVELGVFTALVEAPLALETLTNRIGIDQRGAHDFFDALVALGLLERDHTGRYACTPETALYLDRQKPTYLGDELEYSNAPLYGRWNLLTRALKSGKPQNAAGGKVYPGLYADPTALEAFAKAMSAATLQAAMAMTLNFPWLQYQSVIDIGAAQGCLPVQIARTHAHLTGGGFDLPPMAPVFDQYVQERGLSNRLRFYPGDFFHDPLPTADVLIMGRVLHNWDLATKKMLLKKVYDALPAEGALIVYERLIDDERRDAAGLLSSLNMLIMTEGGFEFTATDCIGWMREIGFRGIRVEPLTSDQSMIIGMK
jgi:O-methyltransferase domain/Dimerisation domain